MYIIYMCHSMLVQCFELQGRCFTHIYPLLLLNVLLNPSPETCVLASTRSSSTSPETTNGLNKSNTTVTHLYSNNIPLAAGKLC